MNGKARLLEPIEDRGDVHYCRSDGDQLPQTWSYAIRRPRKMMQTQIRNVTIASALIDRL